VFLDHARIALFQVEAAAKAAQRAGAASGTSFALGFLTGYDMDWLPAVMSLLREQVPSTEIVIYSQSSSPDLAAGLMAGKIDLAFLRQERNTPGLAYRLLVNDPLVVLMPAAHRLAAQSAVRPEDFAGETLIGVPKHNAPALRQVTDSYGVRHNIDMTPHHEALNLAMAISLVISTGGIALMPLYARNLLPPTVVSRPVQGAPPLIDLSIGYSEANRSPLLRHVLSKIEDLKFRVSSGTV
jgi:LysR family hca operon transcriptional activator